MFTTLSVVNQTINGFRETLDDGTYFSHCVSTTFFHTTARTRLKAPNKLLYALKNAPQYYLSILYKQNFDDL